MTDQQRYSKKYYEKNKDKIKAKAAAWSKKNRKKHLQIGKKWRDKNPDKVKAQSLKQSVGITLELYNKMFVQQNGCCAICKTPQEDLVVALCVDHNHDTGAIRGLLCRNCNSGLGRFKDKLQLILKAAEYLKQYE